MTSATTRLDNRRRAWVLATLSGAAIAVLGGLIGLGGAEFRLPVLIGLFGLAARRAVPLNLLISLVTVATALATRALQGDLASAWEWRPAIVALAVGGVIGAWLGVRLAGRLHGAALEKVIAGLLLAIALLLAIEAAAGDSLLGPFASGDGPVALLGLSLGLVIGVVSSLLGVAGGELLIPDVRVHLRSRYQDGGHGESARELPTVAVGILRYRAIGAYSANDSIRIGLPMALGSIAGAMIGARLLGWVDVRMLKALLATVLGVSALRMWRPR